MLILTAFSNPYSRGRDGCQIILYRKVEKVFSHGTLLQLFFLISPCKSLSQRTVFSSQPPLRLLGETVLLGFALASTSWR